MQYADTFANYNVSEIRLIDGSISKDFDQQWHNAQIQL